MAESIFIPAGIDSILNNHIPFRRHINDILEKIVSCTISLGVDPIAGYKWHNGNGDGNSQNNQINDIMDLIVKGGAVATAS